MHTYKKENYISPSENICVEYQQDQRFVADHTHEFLEIIVIDEGSGIHSIDGCRYAVQAGDVLFINFGSVHAYESEKGMSQYNILINPEFFSEQLINSHNAEDILTLSVFEEFGTLKSRFNFHIRFPGRELGEIAAIASMLHEEFTGKKKGYKGILISYVSILLLKSFRVRLDGLHGFHDAELCPLTPDIIAYIRENCTENLTLNDIAARCYYNPSYLSRLFKETYGISFKRFMGELRIKKAARLLTGTTLSVEQICHEVGYSDRKHFGKLFREYFGATPQQYRKKNTI